MYKKPKILVVGSFVMDLIISARRFPSAGESVFGTGFATAPGGKGANQAIQASRLGAKVIMAGKVGSDDFGRALINSAVQSGVDTRYVAVSNNVPSAVGNVQLEVSPEGTQNRIIVYPGANMEITKEDILPLKEEIQSFDMVILQNEIPMEINTLVASFAKEAGVKVMLNPAPTAKLPVELLSCLTYITPNEHEAEDLTGIPADSEKNIEKQLYAIKNTGVKNAIITLGKRGAAFLGDGGICYSPSVDWGKTVDPTAAGDSFIGAFSTAVAAGISVTNALRFANAAAGISVTRMGAQTSLPALEEVLSVMKVKGFDIEPFNILLTK